MILRLLQVVHLLFVTPIANALRYKTRLVATRLWGGVFGFTIAGWLLGPIVAESFRTRFSGEQIRSWAIVGINGCLVYCVLNGLLSRKALVLNETWIALCELLPSARKRLTTLGILKRSIVLGDILLLWIALPAFAYFYGSNASHMLRMGLAASIFLVLCASIRAVVALTTAHGGWIRPAIGSLSVTCLVAASLATWAGMDGMIGLWRYLPQHALCRLLASANESPAGDLCVVGGAGLAVFSVLAFLLFRMEQAGITEIACRRSAPARLPAVLTRAIGPSVDAGGFGNSARCGIVVALRDRAVRTSLVPECLLLLAVSCILVLEKDEDTFKAILLVLVCYPFLELSKALLLDVVKVLWMVRIARYAVWKALAGYAIGIWWVALCVAIVLLIGMQMPSMFVLKINPIGGLYETVMFSLWVGTVMTPFALLWGMWARAPYIRGGSHLEERPGRRRSHPFILFVLMVLLPGFYGFACVQDWESGPVSVGYWFLGGYWCLALFGRYSLGQCAKADVVS